MILLTFSVTPQLLLDLRDRRKVNICRNLTEDQWGQGTLRTTRLHLLSAPPADQQVLIIYVDAAGRWRCLEVEDQQKPDPSGPSSTSTITNNTRAAQEQQEGSQSEAQSKSGPLHRSTCLPCPSPSGAVTCWLRGAYRWGGQEALQQTGRLQTGESGGALNSYVTPPFTRTPPHHHPLLVHHPPTTVSLPSSTSPFFFPLLFLISESERWQRCMTPGNVIRAGPGGARILSA